PSARATLANSGAAAGGQLPPAVLFRQRREQGIQERMPMTGSAARQRATQIAVTGALWLFAVGAHADPTKDQCVDADTKAQSLRRDGKLSAARDQLKMCAAQACPELVRDD